MGFVDCRHDKIRLYKNCNKKTIFLFLDCVDFISYSKTLLTPTTMDATVNCFDYWKTITEFI